MYKSVLNPLRLASRDRVSAVSWERSRSWHDPYISIRIDYVIRVKRGELDENLAKNDWCMPLLC